MNTFNQATLQQKLSEIRLGLHATGIEDTHSIQIEKNVAHVSIQFPTLNNQQLFKGKLGKEVSTHEGYLAMQLCALNVLYQLKNNVGLSNIDGIHHMEVFYQADTDWDEAPLIAAGVTDVLQKVVGEKADYTCSLMTMTSLPDNFSVGLACSFTLINNSKKAAISNGFMVTL